MRRRKRLRRRSTDTVIHSEEVSKLVNEGDRIRISGSDWFRRTYLVVGIFGAKLILRWEWWRENWFVYGWMALVGLVIVVFTAVR